MMIYNRAAFTDKNYSYNKRRIGVKIYFVCVRFYTKLFLKINNDRLILSTERLPCTISRTTHAVWAKYCLNIYVTFNYWSEFKMNIKLSRRLTQCLRTLKTFTEVYERFNLIYSYVVRLKMKTTRIDFVRLYDNMQ